MLSLGRQFSFPLTLLTLCTNPSSFCSPAFVPVSCCSAPEQSQMWQCLPYGVPVSTRTFVTQYRHFTFKRTLIWVNLLRLFVSFKDRQNIPSGLRPWLDILCNRRRISLRNMTTFVYSSWCVRKSVNETPSADCQQLHFHSPSRSKLYVIIESVLK